MTSFLGWQFQPLRLSDQAVIEPFLTAHPQKLADYTFAVLAAWQPAFAYEWSMPEPETLVISCTLMPGGERHLLQPVGKCPSEILKQIVKQSQTLSYAFHILSVGEPCLTAHPRLEEFFKIHAIRDGDNYIYRASDLATLEGRAYVRKRNLVSQAARLTPWSTEPVSPRNLTACLDVLTQIEHDEPHEPHRLLEQEIAALKFTLENFAKLHQRGILVRVAERPVAFALYETLGPDTAAVHFERALRAYKGLYQVINKETARTIVAEGLTLINREEDIGDEGLRKAKLSYSPIRLEPCFWLELRR